MRKDSSVSTEYQRLEEFVSLVFLRSYNALEEEWADEADAAEKAEIKKHQEEEEKHKKAKEEWNKWWNNLSDDEKLSWSMGYGRGSGNWTGD